LCSHLYQIDGTQKKRVLSGSFISKPTLEIIKSSNKKSKYAPKRNRNQEQIIPKLAEKIKEIIKTREIIIQVVNKKTYKTTIWGFFEKVNKINKTSAILQKYSHNYYQK
jgi:hypothetical protein